MTTKISIPRWLASVAAGMSVGYLYFVAVLLLEARGWSRKAGSLPAASQWLDAVDAVLWDFPFGHLVSNGYLGHLLSGLFWAALASAVFILFCRRKHAA